MSELPPENYTASACLDDDGNPFILIEPKRTDDPRLERSAFPLPLGKTIADADYWAGEFNSGRTWAFKLSPGQLLKGDEIPRLHRGQPS